MARGNRTRTSPPGANAGARRATSVAMDLDSEEFLRGLADAVRRMDLDSERALLRFALRVQNAARELCPVDTGRLRSSISHVPGRDRRGPWVDVGTNVEYAPYVEFGTYKMRAQPFLRPALAEAAGFGLRV